MNTDPNAWPTPKQLFSHFWPFVASTLGMLFESVACKFARTDDMRWLCVDAMNDDIKATVALGLLVAPAERSPAFLRAVCDHGTMRRTREIVQIYKTLPRDQHDDVLVNACIVLANVAKLSEPELRSQTLPVDDFVWMIPADKGHMYTTCALEGLAHTWRDDGLVAGEFGQPAPSDGVAALLKSGGLARVAQYMDGPPLRRSRATRRSSTRRWRAASSASRSKQNRSSPRRATRAQHREGHAEMSVRRRHPRRSGGAASTAARPSSRRAAAAFARALCPPPSPDAAPLRLACRCNTSSASPSSTRSARRRRARAPRAGGDPHALEQYGRTSPPRAPARSARCTATRAFARVVAGRDAVGVPRARDPCEAHRPRLRALALAFENSAALKAAALDALGKKEVTSYKADGALDQLIAIDAAYLGVIAVANFFFPYVLPCTFFNPVQLLIPPNDPAGFPTGAIEKKA